MDQKNLPPLPSIQVKESSEGAGPRAQELSFSEIFRQHVPFLWRALVGLGVRQADADDACQEVMLVVHRRLPEFDGRALKSWLYGICLRIASDYRRSARVRREQPVEHLPDEQVPPLQLEELEKRRALQTLFDALERLDLEKRAAFVLFEIEGLNLREIAETMDCPLQTVYSRLQAARAHVRTAFGVQASARSA